MPEQQPSQPPFTGGQCPKKYWIKGTKTVLYNYPGPGQLVTIYYDTQLHPTDGFASPADGQYQGPIQLSRYERPRHRFGGGWSPPILHFGDDQEIKWVYPYRWEPASPTHWGNTSNEIKSISVEVIPVNGVDNCGDLPILVDPSANPYNPEPDNNCCTASALF